MERRDFLKTGLLAVCSLYGLSEDMSCFAGKNTPQVKHTGTGRRPFTGVYSGEIMNDRIAMPEEFSQLLSRERFVLFVPEENSSVLLIREKSPEWEAMKDICDAAEKERISLFREPARIDKKGNLRLPRRVTKYAGIRSKSVAVIGHGGIIEVIDSDHYHLRIA
jgi:DNA-binding transcriptional regulator/RsmH inhibitor MraZ